MPTESNWAEFFWVQRIFTGSVFMCFGLRMYPNTVCKTFVFVYHFMISKRGFTIKINIERDKLNQCTIQREVLGFIIYIGMTHIYISLILYNH